MKYLIDTDWIIDHLKGVREITDRLKAFAPKGLAVSIISLAELYEGVYYSKDPVKSQNMIDAFLAPDLTILGVTQEISHIFGRERGRLRKQKKMISDFDLLIASTALFHKLTLLANNRKHFREMEGLKIVSEDARAE